MRLFSRKKEETNLGDISDKPINIDEITKEIVKFCTVYCGKNSPRAHYKYVALVLEKILTIILAKDKIPPEKATAIKTEIIKNIINYSEVMIGDKFFNYAGDSYLEFNEEASLIEKANDKLSANNANRIIKNKAGKFLPGIINIIVNEKNEIDERNLKIFSEITFVKLSEGKKNHQFSQLEKICLEFLGQAFYYLMKEGKKRSTSEIKVKSLQELCKEVVCFIAKDYSSLKNSDYFLVFQELNACLLIKEDSKNSESILFDKFLLKFVDVFFINSFKEIKNSTFNELSILLQAISNEFFVSAHSILILKKMENFIKKNTDYQRTLVEKNLQILKDIFLKRIFKNYNQLNLINSNKYFCYYGELINYSINYLNQNSENLSSLSKNDLDNLNRQFKLLMNNNSVSFLSKNLKIKNSKIENKFNQLFSAVNENNPTGSLYVIINQIKCICSQEGVDYNEKLKEIINYYWNLGDQGQKANKIGKKVLSSFLYFGYKKLKFEDLPSKLKEYFDNKEFQNFIEEINLNKTPFNSEIQDLSYFFENEKAASTTIYTCMREVLDKFSDFLPSKYVSIEKYNFPSSSINLLRHPDWTFSSSPPVSDKWNIHKDGNVYLMHGPTEDDAFEKIFDLIFSLDAKSRPWAIKALGVQESDVENYYGKEGKIHDFLNYPSNGQKFSNKEYLYELQIVNDEIGRKYIVERINKTNASEKDSFEIYVFNKRLEDNSVFNDTDVERNQDRFIREHSKKINRPYMVHCASGVGRTGMDVVIAKAADLHSDLLKLKNDPKAKEILDKIKTTKKFTSQDFSVIADIFAPFNIDYKSAASVLHKQRFLDIVNSYENYEKAIQKITFSEDLTQDEINGFNTIASELIAARRRNRYAIQEQSQIKCFVKEIIIDYVKHNLGKEFHLIKEIDDSISLGDDGLITSYHSEFCVRKLVNSNDELNSKVLTQLSKGIQNVFSQDPKRKDTVDLDAVEIMSKKDWDNFNKIMDDSFTDAINNYSIKSKYKKLSEVLGAIKSAKESGKRTLSDSNLKGSLGRIVNEIQDNFFSQSIQSHLKKLQKLEISNNQAFINWFIDLFYNIDNFYKITKQAFLEKMMNSLNSKLPKDKQFQKLDEIKSFFDESKYLENLWLNLSLLIPSIFPSIEDIDAANDIRDFLQLTANKTDNRKAFYEASSPEAILKDGEFMKLVFAHIDNLRLLREASGSIGNNFNKDNSLKEIEEYLNSHYFNFNNNNASLP